MTKVDTITKVCVGAGAAIAGSTILASVPAVAGWTISGLWLVGVGLIRHGDRVGPTGPYADDHLKFQIPGAFLLAVPTLVGIIIVALSQYE